jgi:signal transduction histidine kinase
VERLRDQWIQIMEAPMALLAIGIAIVTIFGLRLRAAYKELNVSVDQQMLTSRRLLDVQESERRALARELHDSVGQQLTALSLNLSLISSSIPAEMAGSIGAHLSDSQDLLETTTVHVRDVMVELRPPGIDELGLLAAMKDHVTRVERRSGLSIAVHGSEPVPRLSAQKLIALFRIAQEAINNVVKHARARTIEVELNQVGEQISMSIQDDGIGFDPKRVGRGARPGMGTTTMRERAEAIGARLSIESRPASGTRVEIALPWPDEAGAQGAA